MNERSPYILTLDERAAVYGLSCADALDLEAREPWVRSWATRHGRGAERLRAWIEAGRPAADRSKLCVVGDRRIVAEVRAVVEKLPEPAAHYIVNHTMIVCVGVDTRGWCGERPIPPCETAQLIALATVDHDVIAHEAAHAWARWRLPTGARLDGPQLERLRVAAPAADEQIEREDLDETAADRLASLWLGHPVNVGARRT